MARVARTDEEIRNAMSVLGKCGGNRTDAASALGVPPTTLSNWIGVATRRGIPVPAPTSRIDKGAVVAADVAINTKVRKLEQDLKDERAARGHLERHLDAARAAGRQPIPKPAKRAKVGKDDLVRVIRPDLHGCNQDPEAVAAYLAAVKMLDPDEVVGLGDLPDAGSFLAEHCVLGYVSETAYSVADDVAAVNAFLDAEATASPRARRLEVQGNHCQRIEKWCITAAQRNASGDVKKMAEWLLSKFGPEAVFEFKRRGIDYYRRGEAREGMPPGTLKLGRVMFTHGSYTGSNAMAQHLRAFGGNVVCGHLHRIQEHIETVTALGTIGAWTCGFLAKQQPFWQHGKPSGWTHGFGVQLVSRSGLFSHHNVVITGGKALMFSGRGTSINGGG